MMHAKYTVVLKTLLDDPEGKRRIDEALSRYPLYQKKSKEEFIPSIVPTREELNQKILNHFKYREIAFETVGRFIDELEIAMNEIMPYYNQLFFSADQDYNILFNVDYERTTTIQREDDSTGSTESNDTNTSTSTDSSQNSTTTTHDGSGKNVHSGTPQGQLSITGANIDSVGYADDVTWSKDDGTDTTTGTGSSNASGKIESEGSTTSTGHSEGSEEQHERTFGNFGVMATQDLITKYRDLIINIEQKIIEDERIQELFMMVY